MEKYNVRLIAGSYTTEDGLRAAFASQHACYFNIDSFSIGEPQEYFWTFRAYEIAVQSQLRFFIYAGSSERFINYNFDERFRNSHNVVSGRLSSWLAAQPVERLPWTIITGGVYAEMLGSLLMPMKTPNGLVFAAPMSKDSIIPLVPLDFYGARVVWALKHPENSIGTYLSAGPFQVTYPDIVEAVQRATGITARFEPITIEQWMDGVAAYLNPDDMLPRGASRSDPTAFSFRKSFSAWWALWDANTNANQHDDRRVVSDSVWAEEQIPNRPRSLEEWLRKVNYTGGQLVAL